MLRSIAWRVLTAVLVLAVVSVLIFFSTELLPGDAAQALLGQTATRESVAALRAQLGLDQPVVLRYGFWIWGILHGDLGTSITSGLPVASLIRAPLLNTLELAFCAATVSVPLALALGDRLGPEGRVEPRPRDQYERSLRGVGSGVLHGGRRHLHLRRATRLAAGYRPDASRAADTGAAAQPRSARPGPLLVVWPI